MAQIPSSRVDNPILQQFLQAEALRTAQRERAVQSLEMAPIEMQLELAKSRAMKEMGLEFLEPELNIRDKFEERQSVRGEQRGMRERTHSADEQIRANTHQLETSDRLAEGRDERSQARRWGYREREKDRDLSEQQAKEARDEAYRLGRERTSIQTEVEKKEALEPYAEAENRRIIERQKSALEGRTEAQTNLAQMRIDAARERQAFEWAEKNKFHERFPRLSAAARAGRIKFVEEGIAHVAHNDVTAISEMDADKQNFEKIGTGVDDKNKPIVKYRLLKPAPTGNFVPAPSYGPSQAPAQTPTNVPPAAQGRPYMNAPAEKGGVVPPGSTSPKSGDRLNKGAALDDDREYKPARLASDASPTMQNLFERVGKRFNVDPDILASHTFVESGWNPNARSPVGANGIAQFMPATAAAYGVDSSNVVSSVIGMAKYMNKMGGMFNDNLGLVVAGYNWGEGSATSGRGVLPWLQRGADPRRMPAETRNHVLKVTGKPIEYWVDQYFEDQQTSRRPRVEATNQQSPEGDDLFYVDIG